MQPGAQKDLRNREEVPDGFFTRRVLALTMIYCFSLSVLDVNAAFLYAELLETEPTIVAPGLLKRLGYADKQSGAQKSPGLRVSPVGRKPGMIQSAELKLSSGKTAVFHLQMLWFEGRVELLDMRCFYVDDILLAAALRNLSAIRAKISTIWNVKDQGILVNPADKSEMDEAGQSHNAQHELGFLGMRIGFNNAGDLECHQMPYIKSCL